MWYLILNAIIAVWVFFDAKKRKMDQPITWSIGVFLLMIVVIPFYFAKRPLLPGEVREGGTAWNVIKSFAIFWTLFMFIAGFSGMIAASNSVSQHHDQYAQAGAAIGTAIGVSMIMGLWFVVLVGALVIGLFLKKNSLVERG
jgi:hypothetical protein